MIDDRDLGRFTVGSGWMQGAAGMSGGICGCEVAFRPWLPLRAL